jgi:plastocyanin
MTNKKLWYIFGVSIAAVVIVAGGAGYLLGRDALMSENPGGAEEGAENEAAAGLTREDVPAGTTAPGRDAQVAENIAVPEAVAEAAPGVDSKRREFRVELKGGAFVPDTVIINQGDIARITFTAVDGDYDLFQPDYGFRLTLPQGEERMLEGYFSRDGKYMFYCPSCGGPDEGPKGYIVVVPQ